MSGDKSYFLFRKTINTSRENELGKTAPNAAATEFGVVDCKCN